MYYLKNKRMGKIAFSIGPGTGDESMVPDKEYVIIAVQYDARFMNRLY